MSLTVQFGALRTRELRGLLQDEDKINQIIRCSEKLQGVQRDAEKMLVSNQKLAKVALSHKQTFRDAKLVLAKKYRELENLRNIIQAKQEQLAEKYSLHYAQCCLLGKINHAEEECELLFQRFTQGTTPLEDFLDSFISSRKLQHTRLVLVKKLQEKAELKSGGGFSEIHPDTEQVHSACVPVCSLTTAVIFPACCHPALLLPFATHGSAARCLQHFPPCHEYSGSPSPGARGRAPKWPARPVRLQPLRVQQRRHQQAPQ